VDVAALFRIGLQIAFSSHGMVNVHIVSGFAFCIFYIISCLFRVWKDDVESWGFDWYIWMDIAYIIYHISYILSLHLY
jgi:hypothetical protein